jgi:hypothetical protein
VALFVTLGIASIEEAAMRSVVAALVLLLSMTSSNVNAQTNTNEVALRKLLQAHCDVWNKHDAHALAELLADDGDFVTVATVYLHGRAD